MANIRQSWSAAFTMKYFQSCLKMILVDTDESWAIATSDIANMASTSMNHRTVLGVLGGLWGILVADCSPPPAGRQVTATTSCRLHLHRQLSAEQRGVARVRVIGGRSRRGEWLQ